MKKNVTYTIDMVKRDLKTKGNMVVVFLSKETLFII